MQTKPLTHEQREVLILQINRRMAKWSDEALEQLECLTRSPKALGMQTVENTNTVNNLSKSPQHMDTRWIQEGANGIAEINISRREVFAYGAGGIMTLLAVFTGAGLLLTTNRVGSVQAACNKTYSFKNKYQTVVTEYQGKIPSTFLRFSKLEDIVSRINELQASMSEAFSAKDFNLANVAGWLLGAGLEILKMLPEYIANVSQLIEASQELLNELKGWLSPENHIDVHLFQPLRAELFQSIDDLQDQINHLTSL